MGRSSGATSDSSIQASLPNSYCFHRRASGAAANAVVQMVIEGKMV
jgi:hypothetical protein